MIVFDAPVSPDALTAFVRSVPAQSNLVLSQLFPTVQKLSNQVSFSDITRTNRTARYRAYDGRIHVADRDGYSDKVIKMAPFSDSLNEGEYERLQREFARVGGTRTEALEQAIYDDAEILTRYMQNRMELALGDVLADGIFSPTLGSEFGGVLDFGVPGNHKITVGTAWATKDSADGIADLVSAADIYEATTGQRPGFVITSRAAQRALLAQTASINAAKGAQTGVTRISMPDLDGIFDSEGIPTSERWYTVETQLDVDGASTRVLPADLVIFGPSDPSDLLEFQLGISATSLELVDASLSEMSFEESAGIVGVVEKLGPPYRKFTFVDAIGLPVLKDANKLMVIDVTPPVTTTTTTA